MRTITSFRIRISVLFAIFCPFIGFAQWTTNGNNIYNANSGYVGIGTTAPAAALDVVVPGSSTAYTVLGEFRSTLAGNSWLQVVNSTGSLNLGIGGPGGTPHPYIWSSTDNLFIGSDGNPTLFVQGMGNGNVGIGTTDTKGYKFAVNGNAVFNKVVVKAYPWSDYVFDTDYRLRPLREVAQYIQQNHHLPEVPSAAEVEKGGVDVGQNQAVLLKKIEELTLYVIAMEKDKDEMKRTISKQQKELSRLSSLIDSKK